MKWTEMLWAIELISFQIKFAMVIFSCLKARSDVLLKKQLNTLLCFAYVKYNVLESFRMQIWRGCKPVSVLKTILSFSVGFYIIFPLPLFFIFFSQRLPLSWRMCEINQCFYFHENVMETWEFQNEVSVKRCILWT